MTKKVVRSVRSVVAARGLADWQMGVFVRVWCVRMCVVLSLCVCCRDSAVTARVLTVTDAQLADAARWTHMPFLPVDGNCERL